MVCCIIEKGDAKATLVSLWIERRERERRPDQCSSLTLIALLFEPALGAAVGHFGAALAGPGVSAASARLDALVAASTAFDSLSRRTLLVMILTGTGTSAARLGPHINFA